MDKMPTWKEIEDREREVAEETELTRAVLVRVLGGVPFEPGERVRYRLADGTVDNIFHARLRWLEHTDGALALVKDQGLRVVISDGRDGQRWGVGLFGGGRTGGAEHTSLPRAIIEALLCWQDKAQANTESEA